MSEFAEKIKLNFKQNLALFGIFLVRLMTGALVGLVIAMIAQQMWGAELFVFMFIVVTTMAVILRITSEWGFLASTILLLVFALIGVLLRLYIHTAAVG